MQVQRGVKDGPGSGNSAEFLYEPIICWSIRLGNTCGRQASPLWMAAHNFSLPNFVVSNARS